MAIDEGDGYQGYQCLSVYRGRRCARGNGHDGRHAWRNNQWTDADISPAPMPDPPDCDHPDPTNDDDFRIRGDAGYYMGAPLPATTLQADLRALSVVVTNIQALLTDIWDDMRQLQTDLLGHFVQVEGDIRRRS